jgi:hypothetical protein
MVFRERIGATFRRVGTVRVGATVTLAPVDTMTRLLLSACAAILCFAAVATAQQANRYGDGYSSPAAPAPIPYTPPNAGVVATGQPAPTGRAAFLPPASSVNVYPATDPKSSTGPTVPATSTLPPSGPDCGGCERLAKACCTPCGPDECGWVQADYLLWSVQGFQIPALVARDAPGTPRTAVGLPGTPGQQVLLGNSRQTGDLRSGFYINGGLWLDECRQWAVSGDFFFLSTGSGGGRFSSAGDPPLSRPFFNAATGAPDAELVSYPGVLSGTATVTERNTFVGGGAFLQRNLCCNFDGCDPCNPHGYRLDLLAGYRIYGLNDFLQVREYLVATGPGAVPAGMTLVVTDRFSTQNLFNGALLGLSGTARYGRWTVDGRVGAALGDMHRELTVNGYTVVTEPGQPASARTGGLLAQPSNIGRFTSDTFTVVPELGLTLGYRVASGVEVHVGYTFLDLPSVWRAGDQIDRTVDPAQLRGGASAVGRPAPVLSSSSTIVQGMNFGVTFRF